MAFLLLAAALAATSLGAAPARAAGPAVVDGTWSDFMPPTRRAATLSYDSTRDRLVLFGGSDQEPRNDLRTFDIATGTWAAPVALGRLPLPRTGSASVYDALHDRVWVFGGIAASGATGGIWAVDANPEEWVLLAPQGTGPSPRANAGLVRDAARDRLILYGGQLSASSEGDASGEAWTIAPYADSLRWTKLAPAGMPPPPRWGAVVVYDSPRDRLVILGGRNRDSVLTDSWELRFKPSLVWAPLTAFAGRAPAREGMLGAIDLAHNRIVTFGGIDPATTLAVRDVWSFDLAGPARWTKTAVSGDVPAELSEACAALDSARARIFVQGGGRREDLSASYLSNETWALDVRDTPAWRRVVPAAAPIPRYGQATAYDAPGDAMWIFGGRTSRDGVAIFSNETWRARLDTPGSWTRVATGGPPRRQEPVGAFDAAARRFVVFGGWNDVNGTTYLGDTWAAVADSPFTWTPFAAGPAPAARAGHAGMFDSSRRALVIYGGLNADSTCGDAWRLPLAGAAAWRRIDSQGERPAPRAWASAIDDAVRDRMIVYGGLINGQSTNELWSLSLGTIPRWDRLVATGNAPPGLTRHAAVYDARRRRMLVWGGFTSANDLLSNTFGVWALALDGDPVWTLLGTVGPEPYPATAPSAIYDPRRDRLVTYGGNELFNDLLPDLRALDFEPAGTSLHAWFKSARLAPDGVHLLWQSDAAPGSVVRVEKRIDVPGDGLTLPGEAPPGRWFELGAEPIAGDGTIAWLDPRARAGGTYSYRVVLFDGVAGEVTIQVPAMLHFALEAVRPTPTTGAMALTLRSTGQFPIRADLYDAAGRHVEQRDLGTLPAGVQSVAFDFAADRRAGIYFLRVTQGPDSASRKIVLLQ